MLPAVMDEGAMVSSSAVINDRANDFFQNMITGINRKTGMNAGQAQRDLKKFAWKAKERTKRNV